MNTKEININGSIFKTCEFLQTGDNVEGPLYSQANLNTLESHYEYSKHVVNAHITDMDNPNEIEIDDDTWFINVEDSYVNRDVYILQKKVVHESQPVYPLRAFNGIEIIEELDVFPVLCQAELSDVEDADEIEALWDWLLDAIIGHKNVTTEQTDEFKAIDNDTLCRWYHEIRQDEDIDTWLEPYLNTDPADFVPGFIRRLNKYKIGQLGMLWTLLKETRETDMEMEKCDERNNG